MKKVYPLVMLVMPVFLGQMAVNAQTQRDPSFTTQEIRQPGNLEQVLQLSDDSRILIGDFDRVNGATGSAGCVRFMPNGQVDAAFTTRIASFSAQIVTAAEVPGNKILFTIRDSVSLGGQFRKGLVRLLFDGTYDVSFTSLPQPFYGAYQSNEAVVAVQPDGKLVLAGGLAHAAQPATATVRPLVRLLANGQLDTSFMALANPVFPAPASSAITTVRVQPDGRILLGGTFFVNSGQASPRLIRLLSTGALDASFSEASGNLALRTMTLQPDGKVLVAYEAYSSANQRLLVRLQPTGAVDPTFTAPALVVDGVYLTNNPLIQVQSDGRILVAGAAIPNYSVNGNGFETRPTQFVSRLLANGQQDSSWQPTIAGHDNQAAVHSVQLLPSGQVLIGGTPRIYGTNATALPSAVGVLDNTGQYLSSFTPQLQRRGNIYALVTQPDGRILMAGSFTEVNGQPARNLARLLPTGALDAAFTANARASGGNETVNQVLVQSDGRILVAGGFDAVGGLPRPVVARLLTTGAPDASFVPAFEPTSAIHAAFATHSALQPDGKVLFSGHLRTIGATQLQLIARLTATGAADASLQPPSAYSYSSDYDFPLAVRPNGSIIVANINMRGASGSLENVNQLLPTGAVDPAFTPPGASSNLPAFVNTMVLYPDGRLLVAGDFSRFGGRLSRNIARLEPTGAPDATFTSALADIVPFSIALQPNDRILAAGFPYYGSAPTVGTVARVLSTGGLDGSFTRAVLPATSNSASILAVQADGSILVGGYFSPVAAGQAAVQLIRLLDPNVLAVSNQQAAANTSAYPVPAHDRLHLQLDATAHPRQVQLLDALGRTVLTQAVSLPALTLTTTALPAGPYLLRVIYATGTITRRVVMQ